jgi:hypothetical protein
MDMKLKSMINSKQLNQIKLFGLFAVYPTLFMSPALFSGDTLMVRKTTSDVGHYVWVAQQLNAMKFPWSQNMMIGAPTGVSFWSPAAIVNGAYWITLWVLTRLVSPMVSVNLLLLLGWILSGLSVYLLAKRLGANHGASLVAGIALQMLPWFREKLITHPLYVFWCVPVVVVILGLSFLKVPTYRNFIYLSVSLVFSFFIDLYWFWYSIDIVAVILLVNVTFLVRKMIAWRVWQSTTAFVTIFAFPLVVYLSYGVLQRRTSSEVTWERPLEIASAGFIDQFQGPLNRFITAPPEHLLFANDFLRNAGREDVVNYVGISIVALCMFSLIGFTKRIWNRELVTVWVVAVIFMLLTIPTSSKIVGINAGTIVDVLRQLNPGLRVFSRTGMVSQALLCALAGVGISKFSQRFERKAIVAFLLLFVIAIDLNPTSRRLPNNDYKSYENIREILNAETSSVTLELWPALDRFYFPRFYIDTAKSFTWTEQNNRNQEALLHASRGDEDFYKYLVNMGISHLLIPKSDGEVPAYWSKWARYGSIDLSLDSKYFELVASANGQVPGLLLKLKENVRAETCVVCKPYFVNWSNVRMGFAGMIWSAEHDSNSYVDGPNLSWVLAGERPTFQIVAQDEKLRFYEVTISMVAAFGPKAPPQVVTVTSNGVATSFDLVAGVQQDVKMLVKSGDVVEMESQMPCVVPELLEPGSGDLRELCFGVTDFTVKEVFL